MGKVRKAVIVMVVLFIIAIGALAYLYIKKAPGMLSESLSGKFKVPVKVEKISLSWDRITIKGFEIANLPDSILPKAFSAQTIIIKAPLLSFLKDDVKISEIIVDQIYIGLEFDDIKSEKGNWTRLIENLYSEIDAINKTEATRTVSIGKISLQEIHAQVVYKTKHEKIHDLPVAKYEAFTDTTSEGGFPIDQITNSILGKMLMSLFVRENLKNMHQGFLNPKNAVKHLLSPFKLLIP